MIKINILTSIQNQNVLLSQLNPDFQSQSFEFKINAIKDIVWDMVVVYGFDVKWDHIRCNEGNVVFLAPEPPMMYPMQKAFINQFDHIISCNPKLKHRQNHTTQQCLNWHYAVLHSSGETKYNYNGYLNLNPMKTKDISLIMSSKKMMPGHNRRIKIYEKLRSDFGDQIDYFGYGIKPIDYKEDGIAPYRFHICMENSSIPDYWTEKIADPFIGKSIPIYAGCTNISDYFGPEGYLKFDINNYDSLKQIIEQILVNPQMAYEKQLPAMLQCRDLILNKYNIFPTLVSFLNDHDALTQSSIKEYSFLKNTECKGYKKSLYQIKFKRKLASLLINANIKK